jgi:hypothetical protein
VARLVAVAPPPSGIYRLARGPGGPFAPPDWDRADTDGTFGNRFDDPSAEDGAPPARRFRTIYCATQRAAAFGETMARFRPSLALLAQLSAIDDDEPLERALAGAIDPVDPRRGLVPADWRLRRRVGHTVLDPSLRFVDLASGETMQHLRTTLAPLARRLGVADIDLSSVTGPQRRLTQAIARHVHDRRDRNGRPRFAGIRYLSRLDAEWECWAVFDDRMRHVAGCPGFPTTVLPDDTDLMQVAKQFNLTIEVFTGQANYLRP